ncbi:hypothetical protein L7F22_020837 [Adiantum nelumboides]|nr:hypothetical protein [Adiantum nelumboides]
MEDNGIDDSVAIENFHLIVKPELRGPIEELQGQHSVSWRNFKVALKAEYFLEDFQRVTKQTFIKWVQMKNKGLTSRELLREFEKKFDQLSTGEQQSLRSEKVELFVQAVDSRLQKSLVQLLEDPAGELGLTNDWDAVPAAINLLVKRQKRIDKSIVVDSHEDFEENGIVEKVVEKPKASSSPTLEGKEKPKATQSSTLDDSTMDDLIKGIQELNLNLKAVRLEKSSSSEKPKNLRPELCIWCDSNDHIRKDCDDFNDAFSKNVVFWKDRKIHLTQTGQPLRTNFGRGGMKKIVGEMTSTTSTYAMQVYKDENEEEVKASTNLWPHALRTAEAGKAQTNEAFVEDKCKREDEAPETSKRQTRANTRSDGERMQKSTPIPEVQMEDASKDKKQNKVRGPSYKLRFDIELAINLKKVFEERILNSKVEMTLGDILGIAKRKFHEEIIDIIKRKQHVPVEQETNPTNSQNILHDELEDLEEPRAKMENDVIIADRGELDTDEAWELFSCIGVKLALTTAYNPEGNGKRYMPFELMYGQKHVMPIEEVVLSWTILPWGNELSRDDLLALRIRQLERRQEDIEEARLKLKEARLKNKDLFDKNHRLRPHAIQDGNWVLVYDSSLDNQYTAMRKMVKRWFGPYAVLHVYPNAT